MLLATTPQAPPLSHYHSHDYYNQSSIECTRQYPRSTSDCRTTTTTTTTTNNRCCSSSSTTSSPSDVASVNTITPDLLSSPAPKEFFSAPPPEDGALATQFNDALALHWDSSAPESHLMHGYYTPIPPAQLQGNSLYRPSQQLPSRSNPHPQPQPQQQQIRGQGSELRSINLNPHNWQTFGGHQQQQQAFEPQQLPSRPTSRFGGQLAGHKRNNSGSTVASTSPSSPFTPAQSFPYIHDPDARHPSPLLENYDFNTQQQGLYSKPVTSNAINTFSDTYIQPLQQFQPHYPQYHADQNLIHQAAMRRAMKKNDGTEPPALPRLPTGEFDSGFRATLDARGSGAPRLDRSLSDIYKDELYNPNLTAPVTAPPPSTRQTSARIPSGSQSASPSGRSGEIFSQLLQAANERRLSAQSDSAGDISRERSPFRASSLFAHDLASSGPMQSAARIREHQKAASDAYAYAQHHPRHGTPEEPKTISPKDAFLETSEVDASDFVASGAMFPPMSAVSAAPVSAPLLGSSRGDPRRPPAPGAMATLRRQGSSQRSNETQHTSVSASTPDFHMPMSSMESTRSEALDDSYAYISSQDSANSSHNGTQKHTPLRRPEHTTADSGTYSCTYHNCAQRFETAAKLQKHKRDVHRPVSPPMAMSATSLHTGASVNSTGAEDLDEDEQEVHSPRTTAALLAARNSQAGPHKCTRINPSTGRPCNSIFSRPYDLTRHEDTIHNSRKHKVRCPFCAEEKTFSRADALTRHLRVVHPEKDVPGRRRRAQ